MTQAYSDPSSASLVVCPRFDRARFLKACGVQS